jgi:hypothetical protein
VHITRKIVLSILVFFLTIGVLWMQNRRVAPKVATWDDVISEAERGGYRLINTNEVWEIYQDNRQDILLVDTRQAWEYRTGHIKTAKNFPMEPTWFSRWKKKGSLQALLGSDKNRLMVFY